MKNIFNKSQKISKMRKKYIREISNLIQGNSKVGQMFLHESYLDIFLLLLKAIGDWIAIQYMFRDRLLMWRLLNFRINAWSITMSIRKYGDQCLIPSFDFRRITILLDPIGLIVLNHGSRERREGEGCKVHEVFNINLFSEI